MKEKFVPFEDVTAWVQSLQSKKRSVVFVTGCFDILHVGHIEFLKQARALADGLLLGLESDATVAQTKGSGRPIYAERDRIVVLSALLMVDAVTVLPDLHWETEGNEYVLGKVRPNFLAVTEGDPYLTQKQEAADRLGISLSVVVKQIENTSTSRIVEMISREQ